MSPVQGNSMIIL